MDKDLRPRLLPRIHSNKLFALLYALLFAIFSAPLYSMYLQDVLGYRLSQRFGTEVTLSKVAVAGGLLIFKNLVVHNPPDSATLVPTALDVDAVTLRIPRWWMFFTEHVVFEEVTVHGMSLGLVFDSPSSTEGNWSHLFKYLKSTTPPRPKKKLSIRKLILKDIRVDLCYKTDRKVRNLTPIPEVILWDISSEGKGVVTQLFNSALGSALQQVFVEENLKQFMDGLFEGPAPFKVLLRPPTPFFSFSESPSKENPS